MAEMDTSSIQEDRGVICNVGFEDEAAKSQKGILTLIKFSEKRYQLDLMAYLNEIINKTPKITTGTYKYRRVFDGYENGPSTKDQENLRRLGKMSADIQLSESMEALVNQEAFLSNEKIKSQFYCIAES